MFTDSGSQEHIYGSCHIRTEFVEDRLCLVFDILISSNIQICGCHSEHLHSTTEAWLWIFYFIVQLDYTINQW